MTEGIKLKNTLQTLFPQLTINSFICLGTGNDCNAVLVNNEIVFKIPKHQKASDNLVRERIVLDLIHNRTALIVPHIEYYAVMPNGFNVLGYPKINGVIFTKKIFNTLTEEQKDEISKQIAFFLKELHQIKIKDDTLIIDKKEKIKSDYKTLITEFSKLFNSEQLEKAKIFFEQIINDNSLYSYKLALVHNDFSASNILFDENTKRINAVIDFGDVAITDRDNDFLCLLENSDEEYGRNFGIKVLKYYGLSDEEIAAAIKKAEVSDKLWPYEKILLSKEYNDNNMLQDGLNNL